MGTKDAADIAMFKARISELEQELGRLRSHANGFLGYAMTVRKECTETWLEGLVSRATRFARLLGENGKFVRERDWITWQDTER